MIQIWKLLNNLGKKWWKSDINRELIKGVGKDKEKSTGQDKSCHLCILNSLHNLNTIVFTYPYWAHIISFYGYRNIQRQFKSLAQCYITRKIPAHTDFRAHYCPWLWWTSSFVNHRIWTPLVKVCLRKEKKKPITRMEFIDWRDVAEFVAVISKRESIWECLFAEGNMLAETEIRKSRKIYVTPSWKSRRKWHLKHHQETACKQ